MTDIESLLRDARARLQPHSDSPRFDAELLLAHALDVNRAYLHTWPEREVAPEPLAAFRHLLTRREAGEPVAYLIGRQPFWSLELEVSPATLIPRPETELLVAQALERIPADARWRLADLGTGSGAIALAIASERPGCHIHAVERETAALNVARRNARRLGLTNLRFHAGEWLAPLRPFMPLDLIVSNPPYIAEDDPHLHRGGVRFEPRTALTAGADGLDALRHIIAAAHTALRPGGWLLLEHGWDQGDAVHDLLRSAGYAEITGHPDLAGHLRVAAGRRPPEMAANPHS